ncbi:hypothetical protein M408DRAFT_332629 [Serendipita vermifera MAFF 305830]|uniref:Uncharacterized protein n=1 Tax=Serendipita vermifera MAFF 305830 TaxID=933852 RepID=A0A0C3AUK8_SERVB|nr:hypothetical protein M408DRAFT_332629 [Serendipita vermifera MAFF 305830]
MRTLRASSTHALFRQIEKRLTVWLTLSDMTFYATSFPQMRLAKMPKAISNNEAKYIGRCHTSRPHW